MLGRFFRYGARLLADRFESINASIAFPSGNGKAGLGLETVEPALRVGLRFKELAAGAVESDVDFPPDLAFANYASYGCHLSAKKTGGFSL